MGWEAFVAGHPDGTVFQSPEMYGLYLGTGKMKPVVVGCADADGRIMGILFGVIIREMNGLAGYFSSRTVIYGGPLIDPGNPFKHKILQHLLEGLIRIVKNRSIFIQFRNFNSQEEAHDVFVKNGFYLRDRLNLIVDTPDSETARANMSVSRLRQIRKGFASGARLIEPANIEQVKGFYEILHELYQHKVKKPLPSWDFFKKFFELSKNGKLGIIRLVEYQDKIIGGILSPVTPGKTIYEWYVCGLDQQYKNIYPSVLATWAAIDYAIGHGIPKFDFMGVGIPDREYGVRDFKARFGGEQVNYGRYARINNRFFYGISEAGYNILTLLKKI
jgi:serine/alanine adding enzyme